MKCLVLRIMLEFSEASKKWQLRMWHCLPEQKGQWKLALRLQRTGRRSWGTALHIGEWGLEMVLNSRKAELRGWGAHARFSKQHEEMHSLFTDSTSDLMTPWTLVWKSYFEASVLLLASKLVTVSKSRKGRNRVKFRKDLPDIFWRMD